MLLLSRILPTLMILSCGRSEEDEISDCNQKETFNLADMGNLLTFSGKATCRQYKKIYKFNPYLNATKGRVMAVAKYSGRPYLNFDIYEFTAHPNGSIARRVQRPAEIMGAKIWFAPTTGILVEFTRDGGSFYDYYYSFTGTIAETPLNHHCPYPFLDLQPFSPVVLEDTMVMYKCDVLVTAPEDFEIRIDYIKDTDADHTTVIKIYDGSEVLERISSFPLEDLMTGLGEITIDVDQTTDYSHQLKMQISAVKLNCTCGSSEVTFNAASAQEPVLSQSPDYPNTHCRMISCVTAFTLPTELRSKYKIKMDRFAILNHGTIEIKEGASGIATINDRMTRSFTFESPTVTLKYLPEGKRYGDVFSIGLELIERQKGCDCPHQHNISFQFAFDIPAHCKQMDCIYELPQFDDSTVEFSIKTDLQNDYIGSRRTGMEKDRYSYKPGTGTFDYDTWANRDERMIIRFHREEAVSAPTEFRFDYTTSGVRISHAERCGCFNKTIILEANQVEPFTSPLWDAHYCNNLVCVTSYVAPVHHHLEVKFEGLISLEPLNDRIAFFEGTNISGKHMELLTGEVILTDPVSSSGTVMTTVFISNGAVTFDGFNGTISAVMDKSWSHYLKHHVSWWWWGIAVLALLSICAVFVIVWKRTGGLRRSPSIHLLDM